MGDKTQTLVSEGTTAQQPSSATTAACDLPKLDDSPTSSNHSSSNDTDFEDANEHEEEDGTGTARLPISPPQNENQQGTAKELECSEGIGECSEGIGNGNGNNRAYDCNDVEVLTEVVDGNGREAGSADPPMTTEECTGTGDETAGSREQKGQVGWRDEEASASDGPPQEASKGDSSSQKQQQQDRLTAPEPIALTMSTISTMSSTSLCFHPVHRHSFRQLSSLGSVLNFHTVRRCAGCNNRLKSLFGGRRKDGAEYEDELSGGTVLKCVACGVFAHRSCAFQRSAGADGGGETTSGGGGGAAKWTESNKCRVNTALILECSGKAGEDTEAKLEDLGLGLALTDSSPDLKEKEEEAGSAVAAVVDDNNDDNNKITQERKKDMWAPAPKKRRTPPLSTSPLPPDTANNSECASVLSSRRSSPIPTRPIPIPSSSSSRGSSKHHQHSSSPPEEQQQQPWLSSASSGSTPERQPNFFSALLTGAMSFGSQNDNNEGNSKLHNNDATDALSVAASEDTAASEEARAAPLWTPSGPPTHWANSDKLRGIKNPTPPPTPARGVRAVGGSKASASSGSGGAAAAAAVGPPAAMFRWNSSLKVDCAEKVDEEASVDAATSNKSDVDEPGRQKRNAQQPFSSVSKALQENVLLAFFGNNRNGEKGTAGMEGGGATLGSSSGGDVNEEGKEGVAEKEVDDKGNGAEEKDKKGGILSVDEEGGASGMAEGGNDEKGEEAAAARATPLDVQNEDDANAIVQSSSPDSIDMKALLKEVDAASPPPPKPPPPTATTIAKDAVHMVKTSARARRSLAMASVAGGIAGGVAGLCIAGPAGAIIGAKLAQTAGVLGVIVEGSVSVGVFVAGIAAAGYTANQIKGNVERRVLTIGERGTTRKVVLVRPNVVVDPVWEDLTTEARRTYMDHHGTTKRMSFSIIANHKAKVAEMARRERYLRDSDVVETDEREINTEDKVLLLVSRSLNDKRSLPGFVYRRLVKEHRERSERRKEMEGEVGDGGLSSERASSPSGGTKAPKDVPFASDDAFDGNAVVPAASLSSSSRERRQDTHGVIKHVTATLLEVRPGFGSSPAITELSATAVEGLVFGELYDSVFEEIVRETAAMDRDLTKKIELFEMGRRRRSAGGDDRKLEALEEEEDSGEQQSLDDPTVLNEDDMSISKDGLQTLRMLPEAHSAVDKLRYCVSFLECISVHFSSSPTTTTPTTPDDNNDTDDANNEEGSVTNGGGGNNNEVMGADSLLRMVCQHILVAKVPHINAEIAFLEEFARDEQLLKGKEGYALVTMQASLHFLNASTDFERDIFGPVEGDG